MRFESLLDHRCTFTIQGQKTGEDAYGHSIYSDVTIEDVHCRFDKIKKQVYKNDGNVDIIVQNTIFISASHKIDAKTNLKVTDIRDKHGNAILSGVFSAETITPQYSRIRLHHYEIALKMERDDNGQDKN